MPDAESEPAEERNVMKGIQDLQNIDQASYVHQRCNMRRDLDTEPVLFARGDGIYIVDESGRRFLDAGSGLSCAALGFNDRRLVEAARRQMDVLPYAHTFWNCINRPATGLAEKLLDLAPVPMSKVLFQNSGSEANETAIKLAWCYQNTRGKPEKRKIISRWHSYHGSTIAAASAAGKTLMHRNFNLPIDGFLHTQCPYHYGFSIDGETEDEFCTRLARKLEELIVREGADTIAAFIADPVVGGYAAVVPPPAYFPKIQKILDRHDILFVADEIITGMGRTGNLWGTQTFDLRPDIITTAKALSGAYAPISAVIVNDKIHSGMLAGNDEAGIFEHGFTTGGHPVSAAVALEAIRIYTEEGVLDHVRRVSPYFQERVREFTDHPLIGHANGVGLIAGLAVVADKQSRAPFDAGLDITFRIEKEARRQNLLIRRAENRIAITPPLIITQKELDTLFERLRTSLDAAMEALPH